MLNFPFGAYCFRSELANEKSRQQRKKMLVLFTVLGSLFYHMSSRAICTNVSRLPLKHISVAQKALSHEKFLISLILQIAYVSHQYIH